MLHFLVATHGPLADALIQCANMVFGELPNTSSVSLTEEDGIEKFKQDFDDEIQTILHSGVQGVVVLCDLECGTPYNVACTYAFNENFAIPVEVITGVNFPTLLMTADFAEETDVKLVIEKLRTEALSTIVIAKPVATEQDDDF